MGKYKGTVYKVGDWLIHRQGKHLGEIVEIIEFDDLDHMIVVKHFNSRYYMSETKPASKINRLWAKAPMAQLLYSNNIQRR
jgi:hypothetical protein